MIWRIFAIFFILTIVGSAQPHPPVSLDHLLATEQSCWSPAWVTSGFYDWRTVSKYRRRAGLHLGYDIAMPYGAPVAAAWPGEVVAVTPWTSTEWGVTVRSSAGWEVTYGHISPSVEVGARVRHGTVLGAIASDHVDVKMRDRHGNYIPFHEKPPEIPSPSLSRQELAAQYREKGAELDELRGLLARTGGEHLDPREQRQALERARGLAERGLVSARELRDLETQYEELGKLNDVRSEVRKLEGELKELASTLGKKETIPEEVLPEQLTPLEVLPEQVLPERSPWESLYRKGLISRKELRSRVFPTPQDGTSPSLRPLVFCEDGRVGGS